MIDATNANGPSTQPSEVRLPERCGLCRFWARSGYGLMYPESESGIAGKGNSDCRRHAPVAYEQPNWGIQMFPNTSAGDWCGDFERFIPDPKP